MGKLLPSLFSRSAKKQTKAAFVDYAKRYRGVYLGPVEPRSVEHHLVRGFTTTNTHRDTNHCVGQYLHHDYVILRREDKGQQYIIAEIDLHVLRPLHHFFVVPNELAEQMFALLLAAHLHHRYVPFSPGDGFMPRFKHRYSLLSRPEYFQATSTAVKGELARCLSEVRQPFILEVTGSSLFVYDISGDTPTVKTLDIQLRFACTLATLLEKSSL